jgi:Lrp/AsnC family transcriptional regulator
MDSVDRKILAILQEDASLSVGEIANRVNLSQTPCWRRIQKLTDSGVILRRVALVDPDLVGLRISVPDMAAVDAFYQRLIALVPLKNVTSRFAMERVKYTTAYPINGVPL